MGLADSATPDGDKASEVSGGTSIAGTERSVYVAGQHE